MDTLAHGIIGALAASRSGLPGVKNANRPVWYKDWTMYAAFTFGIFPDISSFGIFMADKLLHGKFVLGRPGTENLPAYLFTNYNITHSLLIALTVWLILYLIWRPLALPCCAWWIHLLCDIPVHGKSFFATPIFYPLSNWKFDGWSFGIHYWIIPIYWTLIALLFVIRAKLAVPRKKNADV